MVIFRYDVVAVKDPKPADSDDDVDGGGGDGDDGEDDCVAIRAAHRTIDSANEFENNAFFIAPRAPFIDFLFVFNRKSTETRPCQQV